MDSSWLAPHRDAFLNALAAQGYADGTMATFRYTIDRLCAHFDACGVAVDKVDARILANLAADCPRTGSSSMDSQFSVRHTTLRRSPGRCRRHRPDASPGAAHIGVRGAVVCAVR